VARKKLGEILVDAGVLEDELLRAALAEQKRRGGPLGRVLVDLKCITEDVLVVALSQQLHFPTVDLDRVQVSSHVLDLVTGEYAEQNGILPINAVGKFLDVAMTDPTNLSVIDELRIRTKLNVRSYIAGPKAMERAIARFYGRGSGLFNPALQLRHQRTIDPNATPTPRPASTPAAARSRPASTPAPISTAPIEPAGMGSQAEREEEISALQHRIAKLEALVSRDEEVIKKLLGLLVDKGVATRDEILKRIS
jgi:hypothetical protein